MSSFLYLYFILIFQVLKIFQLLSDFFLRSLVFTLAKYNNYNIGLNAQ